MATDRRPRLHRRPMPARVLAADASPFSRLALTHALTMAGDSLVIMALAGSVFFDISPTAAKNRVALSLLLSVAPFAVVAPFLGPAIDRVRGGRRYMVMVAAAARAVLAWYMARVLEGLLLFPAVFALLVCSKAHSVAKSSLVPTVVPSERELVSANAKLQLSSAVVGFGAAVPGIAVMKLAGPDWVVRLAALVFLAAAVASLRIVQIRPDDPAVRSAAVAELRDAGIRLAAIAMGVLRAMVGFLTCLVAFALRRSGDPLWIYGVVLAASMGGTLAGAALAPRLRARVVEEHLLAASVALVALIGVVAWRLGGTPADILLAAALGVSASAGKLAFDSLVQRDAPDAVQGRWFARFEAIFQLTWVLGALVPVLIAVPRPVGYWLLVAAATFTVVGYLWGRRVVPQKPRHTNVEVG